MQIDSLYSLSFSWGPLRPGRNARLHLRQDLLTSTITPAISVSLQVWWNSEVWMPPRLLTKEQTLTATLYEHGEKFNLNCFDWPSCLTLRRQQTLLSPYYYHYCFKNCKYIVPIVWRIQKCSSFTFNTASHYSQTTTNKKQNNLEGC